MSRDYNSELQKLEPFQAYPYATQVKGRTGGEFKRHKTLGHARGAVNHDLSWRTGGQIFQWDADQNQWVPFNG